MPLLALLVSIAFSVIHKVGNVDNFVLPNLQISKIEKSATSIIFQSTMNNLNLL